MLRISPQRTHNDDDRAFSLVEVVLAIGIAAFAFVAILGLLPTGLGVFRQAMDTSVCAQIAQRVISDSQQTDFTTLIEQDDLTKRNDPANFTLRKPVRYFDEQGNEVLAKGGGALSDEERLKIIYHVNTRVMTRTDVPKTNTGPDSAYLATLTVQVANNPANREIKVSTAAASKTDQPERNLYLETPGVTILTYSGAVGSNQ